METINLAEKLALQLLLYKKPIVIMNQLMFKRVFPNIYPLPGDGATYYDPVSELNLLIDNNVPADRLDIAEG
jgi:hypothetical protein